MKEENQTYKKEIFKTSLQLLTMESQLLSNIFTTFLIAHSILIGSMINTVIGNDFNLCFGFNLKVFLISIIGFLLGILWLLAYLRGSSFYSLRHLQAQENEPNNWVLFNTVQDDFIKGKVVKIGTKICKINKLGSLLSVRAIMIILIVAFVLLYSISIFSFGPWF